MRCRAVVQFTSRNLDFSSPRQALKVFRDPDWTDIFTGINHDQQTPQGHAKESAHSLKSERRSYNVSMFWYGKWAGDGWLEPSEANSSLSAIGVGYRLDPSHQARIGMCAGSGDPRTTVNRCTTR